MNDMGDLSLIDITMGLLWTLAVIGTVIAWWTTSGDK
jgi:hypothetical protein